MLILLIRIAILFTVPQLTSDAPSDNGLAKLTVWLGWGPSLYLSQIAGWRMVVGCEKNVEGSIGNMSSHNSTHNYLLPYTIMGPL